MTQNKKRIGRLLRLILPMVLLAVIIFTGSRVQKDVVGPDASVFYVRAVVTDIPIDYASGEFSGSQKVIARVVAGEHKGKSCELDNPNTYQLGAYGSEGTRIVALVWEAEDGSLAFCIASVIEKQR